MNITEQELVKRIQEMNDKYAHLNNKIESNWTILKNRVKEIVAKGTGGNDWQLHEKGKIYPTKLEEMSMH